MGKKNIFSLYILFSIAAFQPVEAGGTSFISGLIVGVCTLSSVYSDSGRSLLAEAPIWSAGVGELYRVGNVTQLNAVYEQSQEAPALCKLAGGGIASAWQTYAWDSDLWGVALRIFTEELQPMTDEILVNTEVAGSQLAPSIACKMDGGLEVWWVSSGQDGDGDGVYKQRFNAAGERIGGEERVSSATAGDQSSPCVTARKTGGSVGVFESSGGNGYDIYTRFYSANGTAEGVETRVNNYTADYQRHPVVTVLGNGDVLYLWETEQPGSGNDIHGSIYTDEGVLFRDEFPLNNYTTNEQLFPATCPLQNGFLGGWSSLLQDGSGFGVYVRKYDDAGNGLTEAVRVNTQTAGTQSWLALTYLPGIGVLATWTGLDGSSYGIYGQLLTEALEFIGQEFLINRVTAGAQSDSTSVYMGNHTMLVAFQSNDGDSYGIFAQKFAFLTQAPTMMPTEVPSIFPSLVPTVLPSLTPSLTPSSLLTGMPTGPPTPSPFKEPTRTPSLLVIASPSYRPTSSPTHGAENKVTDDLTTTSQVRKDPINSISLHEEEGFIAEMFIYAVIGSGLILCCVVICYCIYRDYRKNVSAGKSMGLHSRQSSVVQNQGVYNHAQQASYAPVGNNVYVGKSMNLHSQQASGVQNQEVYNHAPQPSYAAVPLPPILIQSKYEYDPTYISSPVPNQPSSPTCHEGKKNKYFDGQYVFEDIQSELNKRHYRVNEMQSIYSNKQKGRRKKPHKKRRRRHVSVPSQSENNFIETSVLANRFLKDELDDINNNVINEDEIATGTSKKTKRKTDENVLPEDDTIADDIEIMGDSDQETKGNPNENVLPEDADKKDADEEGSDEHELLLPTTNDDDYEEESDEEEDDDQENDDTLVTFINKNAEISGDDSNDGKDKEFVPLDSTPM